MKPSMPRHAPPPAKYGDVPLIIPEKNLPRGYRMRISQRGVTVTDASNQGVARMMADPGAPTGTWSVASIFVVPDERGKGIATVMLRGFSEECRLPLVYPAEVTDEGSALFDSFLPPTPARTP
jgi:GNAT superfamily N-acetyltransferase